MVTVSSELYLNDRDEGTKRNLRTREYSADPLPLPTLTLTMVFLLITFNICTENGQINTTKTGLNKDLVWDPLLKGFVL